MEDKQEIANEKTKVGVYWDSWYRFLCPYCEEINWYCNGDENDLSGVDVNNVKCWNCKNTFTTVENDDLLGRGCDIEGLEKPE